MINQIMPDDWRDLQNQVARILAECGYKVEVEKDIETVRGSVNIDVFYLDDSHTPPTTCICECKHWKNAVPQSIVHSFRTIVNDYGANLGFIISSAGFQSGCYDAIQKSNIRLLNWQEFEDLFSDKWIKNHMLPIIEKVADPLVSYTEPINSRIFKKADKLSEEGKRRFGELRNKYTDLAFYALHLYMNSKMGNEISITLPIRASLPKNKVIIGSLLPDELLDSDSFREFLDCIIKNLSIAIAEFDEVFGERA